jgi:hypothetical protein
VSHHSRAATRRSSRSRFPVTLFGRTVTRLVAMLAVLTGLDGLLDTQSASSGVVFGLAESHRSASHGHVRQASGDDDDSERRTTGATARAGARAGQIASSAQASQADQKAPAPAPAAAPAATGQAGGAAPAAAPAPPVAAGHAPTGGPLSWAPPAGYERYPVKQVTAAGSLNTVNGGGGDVVIQLSTAHAVGPVVITNCRNAVLIGGQIDVLPSSQVGGSDQRGIYVRNCTGTVHIEGVRINGAVAGSESDGIAVSAPNAVVQIQNVRVESMQGGKSGNHADVFQPWGGVREFRIDRLSGSTNYQGLHIGVDMGPIGRGTVRNTNIASSESASIDQGGQFLWMNCNAYPMTLDNVYVAGRSGRSFGTSIWPQTNDGSCPAVVSAGVASWPAYSSLVGNVHDGRPVSGDFVPAGSVGLGYSSPGYR